jgi:cytochrome oxidase Cu insertion factor (SCO1/SenC/PrrC family)
MGGPLSTGNSTIVSAFQSSLLHQLLVVLVILAVIAVAWNVLRNAQLRRTMAAREPGAVDARPVATSPEPLARRVLRIGFGLIWLFDGIMQAQSAMPVGLANQVTGPAAAGSPSWVVHLVNAGVLIWNNHPITAAVSAVWIQVGIGIWLLVAPRGRWSQAGGIVSVGWGLVVWSFGEAFGGILAPGLTLLFGAPGAVIFYCLAGALVALPERLWSSPRVGRLILGGMGLFFVGMALLQAWPGRGFWQGRVKGHSTGTLVSMVDSMVGTPQPSFLSSWVSAFGSFDAAHGFAVNLFVVIALAAVGLAFCSGRPGVVRAGVYAGCALCLADWVLIEDFGFFGGLGTDPNSMIPIALVFVAGYLALVRPAAASADAAGATIPVKVPALTRARLDPGYAFRSIAAGAAVLVTLLGAAPMALASTNPHADPIVTEASNGTPDVTNAPAAGFSLIDQHGRAVSLASLRGKAIALTFLDPVCTTDCPLIGQEFREADLQLGAAARRAEFIAVVANPIYRTTFYTNAYDRQEGLNRLPNWLFLTGSVAELSKVWDDYGVQVTVSPAGAMVDHADIAFVIDARGHTRYVLGADPGAGTSSTKSSFAGLLDQELSTLMGGS